jgi:hypothetical protein
VRPGFRPLPRYLFSQAFISSGASMLLPCCGKQSRRRLRRRSPCSPGRRDRLALIFDGGLQPGSRFLVSPGAHAQRCHPERRSARDLLSPRAGAHPLPRLRERSYSTAGPCTPLARAPFRLRGTRETLSSFSCSIRTTCAPVSFEPSNGILHRTLIPGAARSLCSIPNSLVILWAVEIEG